MSIQITTESFLNNIGTSITFPRRFPYKRFRDDCRVSLILIGLNNTVRFFFNRLDKTLQDVVYKLVPGLFIKEMQRRKEFYQRRPELAPKVSPEERGEDTERTIFNSQDAISLSIEYIR